MLAIVCDVTVEFRALLCIMLVGSIIRYDFFWNDSIVACAGLMLRPSEYFTLVPAHICPNLVRIDQRAY